MGNKEEAIGFHRMVYCTSQEEQSHHCLYPTLPLPRIPHSHSAPNQWRTEGVFGGLTPPPQNFRNFDKTEPNSQFRVK
jgi:hypothetical protein